MMTMDEIIKQVRMSRWTAAKMLQKANVRKVSVPFAHGKKHYWDLTPERLLEIKEAHYRPGKYHPDKITMDQAAALTRLESCFAGGRSNADNR